MSRKKSSQIPGNSQSEHGIMNTDEEKKRLGTVFVLVLLSFLLVATGIFITISAPLWGRRYWMGLAVIFSLISLVWKSVKHRRHTDHAMRCYPWKLLLATHLLFWAGVWAAMISVYFAWRFGMMSVEASGIMSLLILALAIYADGLWVDKHLSFFGAVLLLLAVLSVFARAYIWLIFIALIVYAIYWLARTLFKPH
jgi:hypothetical protein